MRSVGNSKPFVFVIVIVPLLGTVLAIRLLWEREVHLSDLILLASMYTLTAMGITIGYHRMLTHRSFQPHPVVKFILLVLGTLAVEAPPIEWAAVHIKHHAQSDREGDPHSPLEGLFHAHVGWLFKGNFPSPEVYCRHLLKDRIVVFVNSTFLLWIALSFVILYLIGGWTGVLWGGLVRIFLGHHVTFSVNSVCHTFGKRAFETNDRSRNEWIVGLLGFGEGWHNNHHAFPRSAFHGLHWWQFDLSGYVIWILERLSLAHDVNRVSPSLLAHYSSRKADPAPEPSDLAEVN